MRPKTKLYFTGAIVFMLGLLAGCGPCWFWGDDFSPGDSPRRAAFCRTWKHHRFSRADFVDHIMGRMEKGVEKLHLSEGQREQYQELQLKIKSNLTEAMEDRKDLFKELRQEINREDPDIDRVTDLVKDRVQDMPNTIAENLNLLAGFYNILDNEQKEQVLKLLRKRIGQE